MQAYSKTLIIGTAATLLVLTNAELQAMWASLQRRTEHTTGHELMQKELERRKLM